VACRHSADTRKEKEDILKRLNAKVKLMLLNLYAVLCYFVLCYGIFFSMMSCERHT